MKKNLVGLFTFFLLQVGLWGSETDKKICLTMIVKNEAHIIERLLYSTKDIVDYVCICDTGSDDNTVELIQKFLQTHAIPGKIHTAPWRDFGYNRTLSVQMAQKTLQDLKFSLTDTYLLLLDADMILEVSPTFSKKNLQHDSYMIVQDNSFVSYYNIRLVKASLPWKAIGVTHEYWQCDAAEQARSLTTLKIDDREDGGCRAERSERFVDMLLKGIEEEPDNSRYYFYLAQSYNDLQMYDEALHWYRRHARSSAWFEEKWFSKLCIGNIYSIKKDWDEALKWYLEAYQDNPERAEPLYNIACYYRSVGQKQIAYMFAKQASLIPYPINQAMFIAYPVYEYKIDEELSISADQTYFKEEGFAALNRLLLNKNYPKRNKDHAYKNLKFYVKNVCHELKKVPAFEIHDVKQQKRMTFEKDNVLYEITSFDPVSIRKINNDQTSEVVKEYVPKHDFSLFKGACAPIEFDGGYVMVVYQVVPDSEEYHIHRLVYFNNEFIILKVSKPFIFKDKSTEHCYKMSIDSEIKKMIFHVQGDELENNVCLLDLSTLRVLLEPLAMKLRD